MNVRRRRMLWGIAAGTEAMKKSVRQNTQYILGSLRLFTIYSEKPVGRQL